MKAAEYVKVYNSGQRQGMIEAASICAEYRKMCINNGCSPKMLEALYNLQKVIIVKSKDIL